jgi:hypothetical protein
MQTQVSLPNPRVLATLAIALFAVIALLATLMAVRWASVPSPGYTVPPAVHTLTPPQTAVQAASAVDPDSVLPICRRAGGPRC